MRNIVLGPNHKVSPSKGESGRLETKDLPPIPNRQGKIDAVGGPSGPGKRDASRKDGPLVTGQLDPMTTRRSSSSRPKKSSKEPLKVGPDEILFKAPRSDIRRERPANRATIIPFAPPPNGSETVDVIDYSIFFLKE